VAKADMPERGAALPQRLPRGECVLIPAEHFEVFTGQLEYLPAVVAPVDHDNATA
jgi:hypothetical protein